MYVLSLYSLDSLKLEKDNRNRTQDLLCPRGKYIHLRFFLAPFSILRPTSSHLVRKNVSADDSFLRSSRASYSLFIAGHSGPCHWSRKTWDSGVHLMGRKNRLVVIILDYTLESTLIVFFFFFLSSVGQATYYTKSASIFGGRKEKNKQTNKQTKNF